MSERPNLRCDLLPEVEAFLKARGLETTTIERYVEPFGVIVVYETNTTIEGTRHIKIEASDWSEMLTKLRERFP